MTPIFIDDYCNVSADLLGCLIIPPAHKIQYDSVSDIADFKGIKIRIRPTISMIDLHCFLFLKNKVYPNLLDFTRDEFSLETFTKLDCFAKELFDNDARLDYSVYDHVINFEDTVNITCMVELFQKINSADPTPVELDLITNAVNAVPKLIDKNHSASIVKLCLEREQQLSLRESERFWSIVEIYNTTATNLLYDTIYDKITEYNYGILLT